MDRILTILKELRKTLDLKSLPIIELVKYAPHGIIIAQKSLKTRDQRIQNAKETILLADPKQASLYRKVLLIDDFV